VRVTVAVPATSANLGPGFDCFGLALDLCNEVTADTELEPGAAWEGEGADELPVDGSDLVSRTVAEVATGMGLPAPAVAIHGRNRVPLERGLGSSSAATVAGVVIASAVLQLGWERDPATVFAAAARIEGHPDNVAAASWGGFTLALPDGSAHRLDPHPALRPVLIVPPDRVPTSEARAALAPTVPRADAVFNLAHAALMVEAVTRAPGLLGTALRDHLHEDARLAALPEVAERLELLRAASVPACVSGAGPSLLAFELDGRPAITPALLDAPPDWTIVRPAVRATGYAIGGGATLTVD
jgi:homoserine kinase